MPPVGYADAQRKRMTGILIVIGVVLLAVGVWLIILGSG
jgi:predicted nucleic acid-binding Zn ribbon protein